MTKKLPLAVPLFLLSTLAIPQAVQRSETSLPNQGSNLPDIAIFLTDQQRADAMGIAGRPGLHTPAMDRLAQEGVRFTNAFCATPQCSPSRAALLSGRYPHRTGVMGNVEARESAGQSAPLDPQISSLGKIFSQAGYQTAYFGKWHLGNGPRLHGFDIDGSGDGRAVAAGVINFLNKRSAASGMRRPLLLFVSWLNPHEIYQIAGQVDTSGLRLAGLSLPQSLSDDLSQKPVPQRLYLQEDQGKPFRSYTANDWLRYIAFYNSLVEKVDQEIGRVLQALRSQLPNVLVVFSSDHGDLGGAHGLPFKGPAMYEELVRVPLIISWPGKIRPAVKDELVSNIDVLPTLCELAGLRPPESIDGVSLQPLLTGGRDTFKPHEMIVSEYYGKQNWRVPIRMLRTNHWKYVRTLHYGEELYDLQHDPHELHNLATMGQQQETRKRLSERVERWMKQTQDPFLGLTVTDRAGRVVK
ncbi:MAG TPA: sulfatase-like hydrolase/transferase [Acidobacteriota bacterium]|nr:sulfatase-like hydrolase/transferase [Acidobacteriota bacterium]